MHNSTSSCNSPITVSQNLHNAKWVIGNATLSIALLASLILCIFFYVQQVITRKYFNCNENVQRAKVFGFLFKHFKRFYFVWLGVINALKLIVCYIWKKKHPLQHRLCTSIASKGQNNSLKPINLCKCSQTNVENIQFTAQTSEI